MKAHGEFLIKSNGKVMGMCGSDSYVPLDGRMNIENHCNRMREVAKSLKNIKPNICGFKIFQGELSYKETKVLKTILF